MPADEPERRPTRRGGKRTATPQASGEAPDVEWFGYIGPSATSAAETAPSTTPKADPETIAAEIVARLNPEQARAVTTTKGPLLILAGAGSGKTRVLAHRVAYLIGVKGVRPWNILAVTFTNKAAGEMRERIIGLVGEEAGRQVAMGTFHSLCARVLRRDGRSIGIDARFTVYDTDDQTSLMKQVLRELDLAASGETAAGGDARPGQPLEERPRRAGRGDRDRAHLPRAAGGTRLRRLPGPPAQGGRRWTSTTC